MAVQLPQNPTDGQTVTIGIRTIIWSAAQNRWNSK